MTKNLDEKVLSRLCVISNLNRNKRKKPGNKKKFVAIASKGNNNIFNLIDKFHISTKMLKTN